MNNKEAVQFGLQQRKNQYIDWYSRVQIVAKLCANHEMWLDTDELERIVYLWVYRDQDLGTMLCKYRERRDNPRLLGEATPVHEWLGGICSNFFYSPLKHRMY
jgi:hypothetical protein